ncbi:hypothetical protein ABT298_07845 [Streptomyces sp. NPDC001034]|uniref:hypothetical protein n=1 Tax=Streptomyces sp. NPDC001034 TaxID=3154375 RepID=UPI0033216707
MPNTDQTTAPASAEPAFVVCFTPTRTLAVWGPDRRVIGEAEGHTPAAISEAARQAGLWLRAAFC